MVQNLMWLYSLKGASQFQLPPAWGRYHSGHTTWIKNPGLGVFEAGVRAWPQCDVSCVTSVLLSFWVSAPPVKLTNIALSRFKSLGFYDKLPW